MLAVDGISPGRRAEQACGAGPVAFIDFDSIRPNHPLIEFGNAAWRYVPLGDEAYFHRSEFPSPPDLTRRLSLFARAYGAKDPDEVLWSLHQAKQRTVEAARYWPITPGPRRRSGWNRCWRPVVWSRAAWTRL